MDGSLQKEWELLMLRLVLAKQCKKQGIFIDNYIP